MCAKKKSSKKSNQKNHSAEVKKKTNHFLQNKIAWENHSDEKKIDLWISLNNQIQITAQIQNPKYWSKKFEISTGISQWCFKIGLDFKSWFLSRIWKPENIDANLNCNQSKSGKYFYVRIGERKTTKTRNQNRTFCIWPFNRDF